MDTPHKRCSVALVCLIGIATAGYLITETRRSASLPVFSAKALAERDVQIAPVIEGHWDLIWKDLEKRRTRVQICVQQNGTRLAIHSEGNYGIRNRRNRFTSGLVTRDEIAFTLRPKSENDIVFSGKLEGNILCGTTSEGFPWMAIRILSRCDANYRGEQSVH